MISMVLTDLDHTLLREDGSISEETLHILDRCRAKGMLFAVVTARYWIAAEPYITLLKPDYEITTDGTLLHRWGECLYSRSFSAEETARILRRIFAAAPGAEVSAACGRDVYWNNPRIAASDRLHKARFFNYSTPLPAGANTIIAELKDESIAQDIAGDLGCQLQGYRGEQWYAFLPRGAGKREAIQALIRESGVCPGEIVAFGDDLNDVDMLKLCGRGVAVANAVPEVLAAADERTLSNDRDGVAAWLNCHCLYPSLLSGAYNTRDLGGYPSLSGRSTVKGRIWRSGALTVRNEADEAILKAQGITTLIDLRTAEEALEKPCAYAGREGFVYVSIPLTAGSVPPDTLEEVPSSYMRIAEQPETAGILRAVGDAQRGVLIFCTAGKDRTGVISALLLLACGVDPHTIAKDYALSREYNRIRLEEYCMEHPEVNRSAVTARESSMEQFIALFLERYGNIGFYAAQAGLGGETLTRIRTKLLERV